MLGILKDERAAIRDELESMRMEAWDEYRSLDHTPSSLEKSRLASRAETLQEVINLLAGE